MATTRVRCPDCFAAERCADYQDPEFVLDMHRLSGRCRAVKVKPAREHKARKGSLDGLTEHLMPEHW